MGRLSWAWFGRLVVFVVALALYRFSYAIDDLPWWVRLVCFVPIGFIGSDWADQDD